MSVARVALRVLLGTGVLLLVLCAVALVAARVAVHVLPEYRAQVEARVSDAIGQPVQFDALDLHWAWGDLRVALEDVRLGNARRGLSLPRLAIHLDLLATLRDRTPRIRELVLVQPRVTVRRERDGDQRLVGVGVEPRLEGIEALNALMAQPGRLRIEGGRLDWIDRIHDARYAFTEVDAAVDERDGVRRLAGTATLPGAWGERIRFVAHWPEAADAPVTDGPVTLYAAGEEVTALAMERLFGRPDTPPFVALSGSIEVWAHLGDGLPAGDGRARSGAWTVRASGGSASLPRLFRAPIPFDALAARGRWSTAPERWTADVERIEVANEDGDATGRVRIDKTPGAAPFIDVRGRLEGRPGNGARTGRYLPVGIMPSGVVDWLDESITAGTATRAEVIFHGPADRFPFDGGEGRFDVRADVDGVRLAYLPGWPALTELDGRLHFSGRSMRIDADRARISGARVTEARARIDNLRGGALRIRGQVTGPGDAFLGFLRSMPPARDALAAPLAPLRLDGQLDLDLDLTVPFDGAPVDLNGRVAFDDARVHLPERAVAVEGLNGAARFDRRGITAEGLRGRFLGSPLAIDIRTAEAGPETPERIRVEARADALEGARLLDALGGPTGLLAGAAEVRLQADFPTFTGGEAAPAGIPVQVTSDLQGMEVAAPAPFAKPAGEAWPGRLRLRPGAGDWTLVHLRLEDRLDARLEVDNAGGVRRAGVRFGGGAAQLPDADRTRLAGRLERLDVLAWRRWLGERADGAGEADGAGGARVDAFDVTVDVLALGGVELADQRIRGRRDVTGWLLELDGPQARGTVDWPHSPELGIDAQLDTLRLTLPAAATDESAALDVSAEALAGVDPSAFPGLRLVVGELELEGRSLGRLQVLGAADVRSYTLGSIALRGDHHDVSGSASWRRDQGDRTELDLRVRSDDMGELFAGLGYRDVIDGGRGRGRVQLAARSPPLPLAFDTLDGSVALHLRDGHLTRVEPGAGRVFGLLSVANLPRRLMLNFGDVFDEGLAFDRIDAEFTIRDGIADPETLRMQGPSVDMVATGPVDLVTRTYDQVLTVTPRASSALPLLGGVFGGPPGAAAMLLAQQLFSDQLDRVAEVRYRLTGPWLAPVLEPVRTESSPAFEREPSR